MFGFLVGVVLSVYAFADAFSDATKTYERGDYKTAATLWTKACDGGNAVGCGILGILYDNGQGVKQGY